MCDKTKNQEPALQAVFDCHEEFEVAARRLVEVTEAAFPEGTLIEVNLGRSPIVGEVLAASGVWWGRPSMVSIRNIHTGKTRQFEASGETHNVRFLTEQ